VAWWILQLTLEIYDPTMSSSATALGCSDPNCVTASYGAAGQCTATPPNACEYTILYGDGSTTDGYILSDVLTFQDSPNTTATATIFFGSDLSKLSQCRLILDPK
jgi:hypothetical protein